MSLSDSLPRAQQLTLCRSLHDKALQATASEGLTQGPYVAARAGFGPAILRSKSIDSTNASPRPTRYRSFFCVCYAPDLVGALTGIRVNSVSRWHHWFPRKYSQEGRARVDPGFVNADAILPKI